MVLHKELQVCNWNLSIIVVKNDVEVARGSKLALLKMCNNKFLESSDYVKDISILDGKESKVSFELASPLTKEKYLVIKVKNRKDNSESNNDKEDLGNDEG